MFATTKHCKLRDLERFLYDSSKIPPEARKVLCEYYSEIYSYERQCKALADLKETQKYRFLNAFERTKLEILEDILVYGGVVVSSSSSSYLGPDLFSDCEEFTKLYVEKTKKQPSGKIDVPFITKMVNDEFQELADAKDEAEQVDALLDAVYYILQHLASTGLDGRPIWQLIHKANMTKFEKGHMREDGKWMKPSDFVPPDDKIRQEIESQRQQHK